MRRPPASRSALAVVAALVAALVLLADLSIAFAAEKLTVQTRSGRQHVFTVEIAADDATRSQGLMYRTELAPDAGMLFDFQAEREVFFWMKNTYVALDMIFARADGTIASIARDTTPLSERTISSKEPVRFVLEVVAGTARRLGIEPGDRIDHRLVRPRG